MFSAFLEGNQSGIWNLIKLYAISKQVSSEKLSPLNNAHRLLSRYRLKLNEKPPAIEAAPRGPPQAFTVTLISSAYQMAVFFLRVRDLISRWQNSREEAAYWRAVAILAPFLQMRALTYAPAYGRRRNRAQKRRWPNFEGAD